MNAKRRTSRSLRCLALVLVLAMVCSTGVLARDEGTKTHTIKVTVTNGTAYLPEGVETDEGDTTINGTAGAVTETITVADGANVSIEFKPADGYALDTLAGVPETSSGGTLGGGVGGDGLVVGDGTIGDGTTGGGTIGDGTTGGGTTGDGTTGDGTTGDGTTGGGTTEENTTGDSSDSTSSLGGSDPTNSSLGGSDPASGSLGGSDPTSGSLGGSDPASNGTTEENGTGDNTTKEDGTDGTDGNDESQTQVTSDLMGATSGVTVNTPNSDYTCKLTNVTKDQDINVAYALDSNGNGVPDQYEVTVIFKVVNGTWSNGGTGDITVKNVPVRDWQESSGQWIRDMSRSYITAPTGMKPNDGYNSKKAGWTPDITTHLDEEASKSYTFTYVFKCEVYYKDAEFGPYFSNPFYLEPGRAVLLPTPLARAGYTFTGWSDGTNTYEAGTTITLTGNLTLTAVWKEDTTETSGGSGGNSSGDQTSGDKTGGSSNGSDKTSGDQTSGDKTGGGSGSDKTSGDQTSSDKTSGGNGGSGTISGSVGDDTSAASTVPELLNGTDHYAYIVGYEDGTVQPKGNMTRAQVATIFFRLLKADIRAQYLTKENSFTDVSENSWYCTAVSTLVKLGILEGRSKTTFAPNAVITRAELATICARFATGTGSKEVSFSDIQGHWAQADIEKAASYGWIEGYEDGTFRPDRKITRAEAITIINRVLGRSPQGEDSLLDDMNVWSDNMNQNAWYYLDIQEATNSHEFERKDSSQEAWVKLTDTPDWDQYEN